MNFSLDGWTIAAMLIIAGVAFWGIRLLKQRLDEQRYQEHLADLEFEATLLSGTGSMAAAEANDAIFLQSSSLQETPIETSPMAAQAPTGPEPVLSAAATETGPVPADIKARAVMVKLEQGGMLRGIEGYIEVHGNPKGAAILRLRNGKLALLVPHMESEAFLRQNARRTDMIIMAGGDGGAFVVRPLEEIIAENITLM